LANDRAIGGGIFGASILGIIIYALLLWFAPQATLEVTAFLAVALLLGILAWIGYTMATTPPPEPITDIPDMSGAGKAGMQTAPPTDTKK
jgi:predicted DNA-binding transcriptional regulator